MISEEYRGAKQWSRNKQAVFTVVWISFLCAAATTMVFFALFDPLDLTHALVGDTHWGREAFYAAGFFFFWISTLVTAGLTAYLVRTAPKRDAAHRAADE